MRLRIEIDMISHDIDSTDPVTLGRWMVEIFARYPATPATFYRVYAQPSFLPTTPGEPPVADWIADSRFITQPIPAGSPRALLAGLAEQLDQLEALHAGR